mmetsp:Transcript_6324/g.9738  ORF Transcript_6324/g.9738 Transcript_6324/m.9738 type:complete len:149 (-) Transcript_6324:3110-3556(-)
MNHRYGLFENGANYPSFNAKLPRRRLFLVRVATMCKKWHKASDISPICHGHKSKKLEIDDFQPLLEGKVYFSTIEDSQVKYPNINNKICPRTVQSLKDYMESYPRFEFNDRNTPVNRKHASIVLSIPIQDDVKRCRDRQSPAYKLENN